MKIYDCFQFFDEEMLLDLRLNIMNKYVDKFVITEATYTHNGKPKNLIFNIEKFSKFKDKIIYNVIYDQPSNIESISEKDDKETKGRKLINNSNITILQAAAWIKKEQKLFYGIAESGNSTSLGASIIEDHKTISYNVEKETAVLVETFDFRVYR